MTHDEVTGLLERLMTKWLPILGLDDWLIDVFCLNAREWQEQQKAPSAIMTCQPSWAYQCASIYVAADKAALHQAEVVEYHLLHELCHCLLDEMPIRKHGHRHVERTATVLARAFIRAQQAAGQD